MTITGRRQWQRACAPPRDRASSMPELLALLEASGRLELVADGDCPLGASWHFHWSDGHTPGQLLPQIDMPGGPVVFGGDLVPGAAWVHAPITMGYDRFPEGVIDEKTALLEALLPQQGRLVLTHDPEIACGRIVRDTRGRYHLADTTAALEQLAY